MTPLEQLQALLLLHDTEATPRELAEVLWLAMQISNSGPDVGRVEDRAAPNSEALKPDVDNKPSASLDVSPTPEGVISAPIEPIEQSQSSPIRSGYAPLHQLGGLTSAGNTLPKRIPAGSALPQNLSLSRALRPFKRRIRSPHEQEFDLEATIQQIAELCAATDSQDLAWRPMLRPARSRWLDMALVVDAVPSLRPWDASLRCLRSVLEGLGAFRDIRVWSMAIEKGAIRLYRGFQREAQSHSHHPDELIDPQRRRVILMASDCTAPAWHDGTLTAQFARWGRECHVAIAQMLPSHMWYRTALGRALATELRTLMPGASNMQLRYDLPTAWLEQNDERAAKYHIQVPVFTISPDAVHRWAQLVAGVGTARIAGRLFALNPNPRPQAHPLHPKQQPPLTAEQRVTTFIQTASPKAQDLAGLLASVPELTLPVMRTIQAQLLPSSDPLHLAEVLLGGLLRRSISNPDPERELYTFHAGVDTLLREGVPAVDIVQVLTTYINTHSGQQIDMIAWLSDPDAAENDLARLASVGSHIADLPLSTLRSLGGRYKELAERLASTMSQLTPQPAVGSGAVGRESIGSPAITAEVAPEATKQNMQQPSPSFEVEPPAEENGKRRGSQSENSGALTPLNRLRTPAQKSSSSMPTIDQQTDQDIIPANEDLLQGENVPDYPEHPIPPKIDEINVGDSQIAASGEISNLEQSDGGEPENFIPLAQLPTPDENFVGRTYEVAALTQQLTSGERAVPISGIRGLGGIGKTELAVVVGHAVASHYPDGQLMLPMRGSTSAPLPPSQALQQVLRSFGVEGKLPDELTDLQETYLATLRGKRVLILVDDVYDGAQIRALEPPVGCALLVTSRNVIPDIPKPLTLGVLGQEESEALVLSIAPHIGADAARLARLCGYLPLALKITASTLEFNPQIPVARYLERLEAEHLGLLRDPDGDPRDSQSSVSASIRLSYDQLSDAAQQALSQLSVIVAGFDRALGAAVLYIEDSDPDELLSSLYRRSLLDWDASTERYTMHNLVREFARANLTTERDTTLRYAGYIVGVAQHAENALFLQGQQLEGLALFDSQRVHIDAVRGWLAIQPPAHDTDRLLVELIDATIHTGDLRYSKRDERISQLELQRAAAQRLGDRQGDGRALGNLGNAYADLGEARRAISLYAQQLEIVRAIGDRRGEGAALGNLGNAYADLGEARRAIMFYEQQLEIVRTIGDRRGEGAALGSLGTAYAELGEARRAIVFYEQALEIARIIGDRRGEGNALGNLGLAYAELGEVRRAIAFYEQMLLISREIGDRRGEGAALSNLGVAYADQGDTGNALHCYGQALAIQQQLFGNIHPDVAASLNNLGSLMQMQGDLAAAGTYFEQALSILQQILGEMHPDTATSLNNLGLLLHAQGDLTGARSYLEQALSIRRHILGEETPSTAHSLNNLGSLLQAQGDVAGARTYFEQALTIYREVLGQEHPSTQAVVRNLQQISA